MNYLKMKEASERTQLDRRTLYGYIEAGRLPASKVGRVYRIAERDLEQFMQSLQVQPEAAELMEAA